MICACQNPFRTDVTHSPRVCTLKGAFGEEDEEGDDEA